jgi:hypothetical protein
MQAGREKIVKGGGRGIFGFFKDMALGLNIIKHQKIGQ